MYWSMKILLSFPIFVVNYSTYIFCLLKIRIMANPEVNNVVVASGSSKTLGYMDPINPLQCSCLENSMDGRAW